MVLDLGVDDFVVKFFGIGELLVWLCVSLCLCCLVWVEVIV